MLTATTGETTTYYVFGIGLLYQEEDGETLFYHFNNIGSTEAVTDENGQIVETFAYGPYGELLSANECGIMYLYNGEYGVATDENGLYYMRARYYNSEIKRFVNQDVLIGTISDSPTMNRYAYVNGNPISLADPFGLSPSINWNAFGHTALSVIGLLTLIPTPVTFAIGAVANIVNAAWYAAEGNYFEAVCSAVGVFGGGYGLLSTMGSKSCLLMNVLKTGTAVGSIAIGGYDIYQIGYENYQSYVVRGEDFSLTDAVMDAGRIVLDSVAIAGGIKLLSEPVPSCFVAGTLVATAEGHVAIEEIQVGDMVLAGDPETGEVAYKEVTRNFVNESDELIHVHTNGEEIITTPTHPFYVNQFGWTHAADLRAGDVLVLSNGEYVVVEFIQHEILEEPVKVYNFEVEDFHTYFVGESSVLVHNWCDIQEESVSDDGLINNGEAHNVVNYMKLKEQYHVTELANDVVDSLIQTGKLPSNYITKAQARALGWKEGKALLNYAPRSAIGGDVFSNTSNILPTTSGRIWYEADVGLNYAMSRAKNPGYRILYSNDGLIFGTFDHYDSVFPIYPYPQ